MSSTLIPLSDLIQSSYRNPRLCPPPAEKKSNVIQFELTTGCSYNGCNFCTMYKGVPYTQKTLPQFKEHVESVWGAAHATKSRREIKKLKRIFIGAGNALSAPIGVLNPAVSYAVQSFVDHTGKTPSRVALYGNTKDIARHGPSGMSLLNCGGTCGDCSKDRFGKRISVDMVYYGAESGSPDVLEYANKNDTLDDLFEAVLSLRVSETRVSAMIMPGLGGYALSDEHVNGTVGLLNALQPEFVTFIGIDARPDCAYARKMQREVELGTNRPLTDLELSLQTADIIDQLQFTTTIGVHGNDVHAFGRNPTTFGAHKIADRRGRADLAHALRYAALRGDASFSMNKFSWLRY